MEAAAIAVTSESPAGPSISVPNPAGNSDTQVDSQDAQTIPSTSEVPKTTSEKAPVKKTPKARKKKISAKYIAVVVSFTLLTRTYAP